STLLAVHPSREEGTPSDSSPLALLALLAVRSSLARRARRATASLDPLGGSFFSRGGRDERQPPSTLLAVHSSREEGATSDSPARPSWRSAPPHSSPSSGEGTVSQSTPGMAGGLRPKRSAKNLIVLSSSGSTASSALASLQRSSSRRARSC